MNSRHVTLWQWCACLAALLASLFAPRPVEGQCQPVWVPGDGFPGANGTVSALATLQDGSVLAAGGFTAIGKSRINGLAKCNPLTGQWSVFSSATWTTGVHAIAVLPDGSVVIGGQFFGGVGTNINNIARWTGSAWAPLGTGLLGDVRAIVRMPNGDIVAAGAFTSVAGAGGATVNRIARWNGTAWSQMGSGFNGTVEALTVAPNGDLVAGGSFTQAIGVSNSAYVARWTGAAWTSMGTLSSPVYALVTTPGGDVVAGGDFFTQGRIARWTGTAWQTLGSGSTATVRALRVAPDGDLIAGGAFSSSGGVSIHGPARWNGSAWSAIGQGLNPGVNAVTFAGSRLIAGGNFGSSGEFSVKNIAAFDAGGGAWTRLLPTGEGDQSFDGPVSQMLRLSNGDVLVSGQFFSIGHDHTGTLVRLRDGQWSEVPGLYANWPGAMIELPNGDFVLGGLSNYPPGVANAEHIARHTQAGWAALGTGVNGDVSALALLSTQGNDFRLAVGGSFSNAGGQPAAGAAVFNSATSAWQPLGAGTNGNVHALAVMDNGDLIAGGFFSTAGEVSAASIARWDGTAWSSIGGVTAGESVNALLRLPGGDLIAAGTFTTAGGVSASRVARWNGSTWSPMGAGFNNTVWTLKLMQDGSVVAGGAFTLSGWTPVSRLARWNGTAWTALGTGVDGEVRELCPLPSGGLLVGGSFTVAGGTVSPYFAKWEFPGPPAVTTQPQPTDACGGAAVLTVAFESLASATTAWQVEDPSIEAGWTTLSNGVVLVAGVPVADASGALAAQLSLQLRPGVDQLRLRCVVSNPCESAVSGAAWVTRVTPCGSADVGGPGGLPRPCGDGLLDNNDFIAFINHFFAQNPIADMGVAGGEQGSDGRFDNNDFIAFINLFFNAC